VAQVSRPDGRLESIQGEPGSGFPNTGQTDSTLLAQMRRQYSETVQQGTAGNAAQPQQPVTQKQMQSVDLSVATAARRPTDETRLMRPGVGQDQERLQAQREQASRLVGERLNTPIRSLAGARRTQVDRLLAQAEEQMRKGDYYKASATYSGVITAAPDNALAWLGRANALLAAGEYVQAYVALEQGIGRFPQLLSFDFDLPALLGNKDIVDVRRAELEKILTANSEYRMRVLLGYLECYSGLRDIGLQTMRQAVKEAPADSIVPKALEVLEGRGAGPARKGEAR
jgi:tetratricopeptide (TPR) repeat protein